MTDIEKQGEENDLIPAKFVESMGLKSKFRYTFAIRDLIMQIENQNTFSGYVYDQFCAKNLISSKLPDLTRDEFIQFWKSCLLIRSQELYLRLKGKSPPNMSYLTKPEFVPVPLAHLLKALGRSRCPSTGIIAEIIPPELDTSKLPKWAIYDEAILNKWNKFMGETRKFYNGNKYKLTIESEYFPHIDDYNEKSVGLTAMKIENNRTIIRSLSSTLKGSDALIRICNDDLFVNPVRPFEDMVVQFDGEIDGKVLRENYFQQFYGDCSVKNGGSNNPLFINPRLV